MSDISGLVLCTVILVVAIKVIQNIGCYVKIKDYTLVLLVTVTQVTVNTSH
jgi:hypothetical protein